MALRFLKTLCLQTPCVQDKTGRMGKIHSGSDYGAQYFAAREPAFRAEVSRWPAAGVAATAIVQRRFQIRGLDVAVHDTSLVRVLRPGVAQHG